ncbi:MAG: hypothetical protein F6K04_01480 [Leptolyngbya sp. SIO4C5]|nr:hypothetical protein [Leptolyngbya sp. SIO4C5]
MPIPQHHDADFVELPMPVVLVDRSFEPPHAIARFHRKSQATNFLQLLFSQDSSNLSRYALTWPTPSSSSENS